MCGATRDDHPEQIGAVRSGLRIGKITHVMPDSPTIVRSATIAGVAHMLGGREITHYWFSQEYWHLEVFLRTRDGTIVTFHADEVGLAHLFDVASLALASPGRSPPTWIALESPIKVMTVQALWRDEWLLPGARFGTIGGNAHTQYSGPVGTAPPTAVASATVLAGILVTGPADTLAVTVSAEAPLNVDLASRPEDVAKVLSGHALAGLAGC